MRFHLPIFALGLLGAALVLASARLGWTAESTTLEQQVKSAFVVNFLKFTDWPEGAFEKADDPIIIGIVDPKSLGESLAAAVQDKSVRGRALEVRTVTADAIGHCHVLIVGTLEGTDLQNVIQAVAGRPILTIGDAENFTIRGGLIRFYLEDRKVHFEINQAATQRVQLQLSSKLLKLAKVVNH